MAQGECGANSERSEIPHPRIRLASRSLVR
jgi:hypothetical protein